jgi:hypothetical protein
MTAAAPYPMSSWRRALRSGGAPDRSPTITPVPISVGQGNRVRAEIHRYLGVFIVLGREVGIAESKNHVRQWTTV